MQTRNTVAPAGSLVRVRAVRTLPLPESLPDGALVTVEAGGTDKVMVRFDRRRYRIDFANLDADATD